MNGKTICQYLPTGNFDFVENEVTEKAKTNCRKEFERLNMTTKMGLH